VPLAHSLAGSAFDEFLTPVTAAIRAYPVGDMVLSTGLTNDKVIQGQGVMGTTTITPRFGHFSLGQWSHRCFPSTVDQNTQDGIIGAMQRGFKMTSAQPSTQFQRQGVGAT
jgi:hypothetical protein